MRSSALAWTLGGLMALGLLAGIALAVQDQEADPIRVSVAEPTVGSTATTEHTPAVRDQEPTPAPVTSTTVAEPATPTSVQPTTVPPTTAAPTTQGSNGYAFTPKPTSGPETVAPGGALTKHLADDIAAAFGFQVADVETAIAAVVLPTEAEGNTEGWLAPGIYPSATNAAELVQAMVDRRIAQLEARNIPRDQWHRVLTAASVIEKETYNQNEKPAVARVLANRLDGGGPLQMDSIILYPVGEDRIFTTSEERAADSPYNSYRFDGLPPTPIAAPDETSIDAFLNPVPGNWWFYVTIDLDSGETRYAVTYEEHLDNVDLLRAWLADNPTP